MTRAYKAYKGVGIHREEDIYGEQIYIGNRQGCGTFWFENIKDARKFIDRYKNGGMDVDYNGGVSLIPEEMCKKCRGYYSYGTKEWEKYEDFACEGYKERLKAEAKVG